MVTIMEQSKTGQFMKEIRMEKGLTQAALAEQLHVSDKTVSKWENGRSMPEPGLMLPLCEILEISVSELLTGQRITPNEYHEKTEEVMMNLVKETEKSKKNRHQGMIGGLVLLIILIISINAILPDVRWILYFINYIDLLIILAVDVVIIFACGYGPDLLNIRHADQLTREELLRSIDALKLLQKGTLYSSLFIFMLAIMSILRLMDDPCLLGPKCSLAILGLLYAVIANLILLIPIYRLKTRLPLEHGA